MELCKISFEFIKTVEKTFYNMKVSFIFEESVLRGLMDIINISSY